MSGKTCCCTYAFDLFGREIPAQITRVTAGAEAVAAVEAVDDVQTMTLAVGSDSGTFRLRYSGENTDVLEFDATLAAVQAAVRAIHADLAACVVTGTAGTEYVLTTPGVACTDIAVVEDTIHAGGLLTPASIVHTTQGAAAVPEVPAVNEVQRLRLSPLAAAGTFTVAFSGQTTSALAWDVSTADLETALEGLSTIGAGNVTVTGTAGVEYILTFGDDLGGQALALAVVDGALLDEVLSDSWDNHAQWALDGAGNLECTVSGSSVYRTIFATEAPCNALAMVIETTIDFGGTDRARVYFDYTDADNCGYVEVWNDGADQQVDVHRVHDTIDTTEGTTTITGSPPDPLLLRVCVAADTVTASRVLSGTDTHAVTVAWHATTSKVGLGVKGNLTGTVFSDFRLKHHHDQGSRCPACSSCSLEGGAVWGANVLFPCCFKVVLRGQEAVDDFFENVYYLAYTGVTDGIAEWEGYPAAWSADADGKPLVTLQVWKYPTGEYAVSIINAFRTGCVWETAWTEGNQPDLLTADRLEIDSVDACLVTNPAAKAYVSAWHRDATQCAIPVPDARAGACAENDDEDPDEQVPFCLEVTFSGVTGAGPAGTMDCAGINEYVQAGWNRTFRFYQPREDATDYTPPTDPDAYWYWERPLYTASTEGERAAAPLNDYNYHVTKWVQSLGEWSYPDPPEPWHRWWPGSVPPTLPSPLPGYVKFGTNPFHDANYVAPVSVHLGKIGTQYVLRCVVWRWHISGSLDGWATFRANLGTSPPTCRTLDATLTFEDTDGDAFPWSFLDFSAASVRVQAIPCDPVTRWANQYQCLTTEAAAPANECGTDPPAQWQLDLYVDGNLESTWVYDWVSENLWQWSYEYGGVTYTFDLALSPNHPNAAATCEADVISHSPPSPPLNFYIPGPACAVEDLCAIESGELILWDSIYQPATWKLTAIP